MQNFRGWWLHPHTPKPSPPLRISGYAPASLPFKLTLDSNEMDEPGEIQNVLMNTLYKLENQLPKKLI